MDRATRCTVCNCPRPAGSHYGSVTCHACKSFFKRTVQFSLSYTCMRMPRHCALSSERSRSCGACRFRKCLHVGMRPALVRCLAPDNPLLMLQQQEPRQEPQEPEQRSQHSRDSQESQRGPQQQLHNFGNETPDVDVIHLDFSEAGQADLYDQMSLNVFHLVERYLSAVVRWAKLLPDFSSIPMSDRIQLLQRRWLDLLILQVGWNSQPYTDTLRFCEGFSLPLSEEHRARQVPRVSRRVRHVAECVNLLAVQQPELLQLRAIIFLETSGFPGWTDPACIDRAQRRHLLSLSRVCACPVRRARLLLLNQDLTAARLSAMAFFDHALHLEGRVPLPLTEEILRASLEESGSIRGLF